MFFSFNFNSIAITPNNIPFPIPNENLLILLPNTILSLPLPFTLSFPFSNNFNKTKKGSIFLTNFRLIFISSENNNSIDSANNNSFFISLKRVVSVNLINLKLEIKFIKENNSNGMIKIESRESCSILESLLKRVLSNCVITEGLQDDYIEEIEMPLVYEILDN